MCLLTGEPRQGRIGVGWATLAAARGRRSTAASRADGDRRRPRRRARPHRGDAPVPDRPRHARRSSATLFAARDRGRSRLRRAAADRRAAPGRARRAHGRRDRARRRRSGRRGAPRGDARRRPRRHRRAARSPAARPRSPTSASRCCDRCSRCSPRPRPTSREALAATGPASVEWKLDGARIQVHRDGDDVRVFTRNLNDVTARLPEVVEVARGFAARSRSCSTARRSALADDALPRRFQDTMSRFGRDDAASHALTLAAFFFDVLHLDGDDLLDRPLRERARDPRPTLVGRVARPRDRDRRRRQSPRRSSPTRSRPATKA